MRLDAHIHSTVNDKPEGILENMKAAGFDGGIIFSHSPSRGFGEEPPAEERIDNVLRITDGYKYFFPFYFIDPTEPDALEQVEMAEKKGILGYKVICSRHFPGDPRAMPVYQKIASLNRPVMFHSGILYDLRNDSGNFNRPCNFEGLLSLNGLRFSLAHVSWPWTDECIAVYGKFNYACWVEGGAVGEMFVDLTPGTPRPYRKPMFERLLFSGYNVIPNILYGTDCSFNPYYNQIEGSGAKAMREFDEGIFDELELGADFREQIFNKNVLRFIGLPEDY